VLCRAELKEYAADLPAMRAGVTKALGIAIDHLTAPWHLLVLIDLSLIARCAMLGTQTRLQLHAAFADSCMWSVSALASALSWLPSMAGQQCRGARICKAVQRAMQGW
jgi:hypothetical protein